MAVVSPVKGGEKLEAYLKKLADKVSNPGTLRVGFLEGATYPDGTPVAMVAAIQNFGAPNAGIPARPFFSKMVNEKSPEWGGKLAKVLEQADWDGGKALALMGEGIAGQLRQSIVDTNAPELSPDTIARKGSDKPLVDTGHMLASVDKEVTR